VTVALAEPRANPHLAPVRQPCQHPITQFFTGRMPFLPPNQQRTEGINYKAIVNVRLCPWSGAAPGESVGVYTPCHVAYWWLLYVHTWRHPHSQNYITYRNAARRQSSHGRR